MPYRIHTQGQIEGASTAGSVRQADQASYVNGSLIKASYGDEAGVGGDVLSGTHGEECKPQTYSSTVKIEGKEAVRHDNKWSMNHENTWGKLIYIQDTKKYPTPERVDITPRVQLAQAASGTMTDAIPIGGGQIAIPKPGIAAGTVVGGLALHQLDEYRENVAIQKAAQHLNLDISKTDDLLSARAYVWSKNMAPMQYWNVPYSGPINERVARSVAEMEHAHPGTVGAAERGDKEAKKRLDDAVAAGSASATVAVAQNVRITRQSKNRSNCRRVVVISRSGLACCRFHGHPV